MTDDLEERLYRLELALARRDGETGALADLIAPDFLEFGQSGQAWGRDEIVDFLATPPDPSVELVDFRADPIADDVVLVTYSTAPSATRRSSLWVRDGDAWRLRFHQGTPIPEDG